MWWMVYLVNYWPLVSHNLYLQILDTDILNSMSTAVKKSPLFGEQQQMLQQVIDIYTYNTYGELASNEELCISQ